MVSALSQCKFLPLFELALVLVRFDQVSRCIMNKNDSIM
jgi:hypothetical protein